jgi:hypothetical protein
MAAQTFQEAAERPAGRRQGTDQGWGQGGDAEDLV